MKYRIHLKLGQMLKIKSKHIDNIAEKVFDAVKEWADAAGMDPNEVEVKRAGRLMEPGEAKARKFPGEPELKNDRTFAIIATTPHMDRDREIVLSKGIDLTEWALTGVIIDSHNYSELPFGKSVWQGQTDRGVKMHIEAAPTPRGDELIALSKFMTLTASIGFIPTQIIDKNHADFPKEMAKLSNKFDFIEEKRDSVMRIITKSTLLETSIVSVPANPNAIQDVLAKAQAAHSAGEIDEKCLELVTKSFTDLDPDPDEKGVEVSAEWLEDNGFELKDGAPVKKAVEPKKKAVEEPKRTIKVLTQPRTVKVISTPEEQNKAIADGVRSELDLHKGGV